MSRKQHKIFVKCLNLLPYAIFAYVGNRAIFALRTVKINDFMEAFIQALTVNFLPSFNVLDFFGGITVGVLVWYIVWDRKQNIKKFRSKKEHGSAEWGTAKDIEPFIDFERPDNNIILTQSENLTMEHGRGADDRNKNVLVIGGTGTGKTLFFVEPNIMQMHSSYVCTDPKGNTLEKCGKMLKANGYKIKVFNTVNFAESMHYNPFAYFRDECLQEDISKFIDVFMANTGNKAPGGDEFWLKAEKLLYTAYISVMFVVFSPKERNMDTLCDMITNSSADEEVAETAHGKGGGRNGGKSPVDKLFEGLEKWVMLELTVNGKPLYRGVKFNRTPTDREQEIGQYAVNFYKRFKQAAGKTIKSILISCSARLAVFDVKSVVDITSKDDLELDKIGDKRTALFIIISDTNATFNFLVSILYSQMFDLLCDKAYKMPKKRLKHHVRCLLDEFANVGVIPDFDKLIATMRSMEISANVIIQTVTQLKAMYKDTWEVIVGNCDSFLFLGGSEESTLKMVSTRLGKATIYSQTQNKSKGKQKSTSENNSLIGRELKTIDELAVLPMNECILFVRGYRPFLGLKYDTFSHRNFRISGDGDGDVFDVSALITERSASHNLDVPDRELYAAEIDTNAPVIGVQPDVFDSFFDNDSGITEIDGLPYSDNKNSQNNQSGKDDKDMTTPAEEYLKNYYQEDISDNDIENFNPALLSEIEAFDTSTPLTIEHDEELLSDYEAENGVILDTEETALD